MYKGDNALDEEILFVVHFHFNFSCLGFFNIELVLIIC